MFCVFGERKVANILKGHYWLHGVAKQGRAADCGVGSSCIHLCLTQETEWLSQHTVSPGNGKTAFAVALKAFVTFRNGALPAPHCRGMGHGPLELWVTVSKEHGCHVCAVVIPAECSVSSASCLGANTHTIPKYQSLHSGLWGGSPRLLVRGSLLMAREHRLCSGDPGQSGHLPGSFY